MSAATFSRVGSPRSIRSEMGACNSSIVELRRTLPDLRERLSVLMSHCIRIGTSSHSASLRCYNTSTVSRVSFARSAVFWCLKTAEWPGRQQFRLLIGNSTSWLIFTCLLRALAIEKDAGWDSAFVSSASLLLPLFGFARNNEKLAWDALFGVDFHSSTLSAAGFVEETLGLTLFS